jgi:hypothetical protein
MLTLQRLEPWSVMKFGFVASVTALIAVLAAVAVLYPALSSLGVLASLQNALSVVLPSQKAATVSSWFSLPRVLGYTAMLGALNSILMTALSTVGAIIYNGIARAIGGIEVTLRETD